MEISKLLIIGLFIFVVSIPSIFAYDWIEGSLHQHTGYSTSLGPDGIPFTGDGCSVLLEGHLGSPFRGYGVDELKESALDLGLDWLAFSDHSYCLDSSEFDTIKEDCQNAQNSEFTCLWGEELSVSDKSNDGIDILIYLSGTCHNTDYGEAHEGIYGINTFVEQTPAEKHCPDNQLQGKAVWNG